MDWSHLQHKIPFEKNFRWRGGQVSRIEAFTDAVFALSITLLVVTTEVPSSYGDLIAALKAFPAFFFCFLLLLLPWFFNFVHFRRYGLEDFPTLVLNSALLFLVLFYVYPLKLMVAFLAEWWGGGGMMVALEMYGLNSHTVGVMLALYGGGYAAMFLLLALMTRHAWKLRDQLELNEVETVMTRTMIETQGIQMGAGAVSAVLALTLPDPFQGMAGFVYMALPIIGPLHGRSVARREREAVARMAEAEDARPAVNEATAKGTAPPGTEPAARESAAADSEEPTAAPEE